MHSRGRAGFALLEAVIATAIVGTVAVGVLSAAGTEARVADRARHTVEAASLAEYRLAVLAILDRKELTNAPDSIAAGTFAPPLDAYSWTSSGKPVDGSPDLVDIRVEVRWPDGAYRLAERLYRPQFAFSPASP